MIFLQHRRASDCFCQISPYYSLSIWNASVVKDVQYIAVQRTVYTYNIGLFSSKGRVCIIMVLPSA